MPKKVLLIEDDTILRENTAELLELSSYEVITAANGKKGVTMAKKHLPDVVICDIMMPELDGYGVLQTLFKDDTTKSIPFIFLSAKTERKDIRQGMELGADDYLTKPYEEAELIGAIESRLAKVAILSESGRKDETDSHLFEGGILDLNGLKNYIYDEGEEFFHPTGDAIYSEGNHSNWVFLVISGIVKTHKLDEHGKELITGIHKPDDFFGFTCFTDNIPYHEYATAIEDTKIARIPKQRLKRILEENHKLALELVRFLAENLLDIKEQLLQMAYGSVRKKTAHTILKFNEKLQKDYKGNIHILRSDLAGVAGMATETLIRTLSDFKKEGLIAIEDRNIRILDKERLYHIS
ncbi:response regulator [Ulvibacterium sp.]|uniref:response regulator n=1 Tax=Ulvibacterium sp. TaxID=2665914 RepID=UPI002603BC0C|nr:response regulator [Ulvibacterium sp.]